MSSNPPTLRIPDGRQGPGRVPAGAVDALDVAVARRAAGLLPGDRRAFGVGLGTELVQLRPYQPGDDVRQLDAAASARTGEAHVRLQVPERSLTTWIVLDLSPSMAFGTAQRLKSDVAEGVVGVLGRLGARRGGRVALLTCGVPEPRLLAPRGGRGTTVGLRRVLAEGVAADGYDDPTALADALKRIGRLASQPGLVTVISDFRGDPETWRRPLGGVRARHSVMAIEVRDPREGALPAVGHLALVDPETGTRLDVDTSSRSLRDRFAAAEAARRETVARSLRRLRVEHVVLGTDTDWLRDLGRRLR